MQGSMYADRAHAHRYIFTWVADHPPPTHLQAAIMATAATHPRAAALSTLIMMLVLIAGGCAPCAAAANLYANEIAVSTYARQPLTIDVGPAKMTPAGDILRPSVNTAGLKYGWVKYKCYKYAAVSLNMVAIFSVAGNMLVFIAVSHCTRLLEPAT